MKRIRIISFALAAVVLFFSQARISNYKIVASLEFTLIRESNCIRCWAWCKDGGAVGGKDIIEKDITLEITKRYKTIYKNKVH